MDRKDLRMDGEKEIKGHDCKEIIGKMISEEGIGSAELGKRLGVSRQYAAQIIRRGKYGVRCDTFERIAAACGYEILCRKIIEN